MMARFHDKQHNIKVKSSGGYKVKPYKSYTKFFNKPVTLMRNCAVDEDYFDIINNVKNTKGKSRTKIKFVKKEVENFNLKGLDTTIGNIHYNFTGGIEYWPDCENGAVQKV